MKIIRLNSNDCGGFRPPKGHLDTQMYPECEGTETDRNIVTKTQKKRQKDKRKRQKDKRKKKAQTENLPQSQEKSTKRSIIFYPGQGEDFKQFSVPIPPQYNDAQDNVILDHLWRQTNHVDGNEWIAGKPLRSSMVGDVFMIDDRFYVVLGMGFADISPENAKKWIKLPTRDTAMAFDKDSIDKILERSGAKETSTP